MWEQEVTAVIKSFERECEVNQCIKSIRSRYTNLKIIVADDSYNNIEISGADEIIRLEPDSGLSFGRNVLADHVDTPYLLLFDDDVQLTNRTNLKIMYDAIKDTGFNLVGGQMSNWIWHGLMEKKKDGFIWVYKGDYENCNGHKKVDFTHNFFLADAEIVRQIRWDDKIKIGAEHLDFFWRGRGMLNACFVPCYVANMKMDGTLSRVYQKHRHRNLSEYWDYLHTKHDIKGYKFVEPS